MLRSCHWYLFIDLSSSPSWWAYRQTGIFPFHLHWDSADWNEAESINGCVKAAEWLFFLKIFLQRKRKKKHNRYDDATELSVTPSDPFLSTSGVKWPAAGWYQASRTAWVRFSWLLYTLLLLFFPLPGFLMGSCRLIKCRLNYFSSYLKGNKNGQPGVCCPAAADNEKIKKQQNKNPFFYIPKEK